MHSTASSTFTSVCILLVASSTILFLNGANCESGSGLGLGRTLPPTMDRLIAAYPEDLDNRRFITLADFEQVEQASFARIEPADGGGNVQMTTQRARLDTGVGSLAVSLTGSADRLIIEDAPENAWGLHRDWSSYHLLMFSVYTPRAIDLFRVSVRSGTDNPQTVSVAPLRLNAGWNLVRVDLGEARRRIDLHNVRELRMWVDGLEEPITLYFDDMLLADNTRMLMSPLDGEPGDLYAEQIGQRLAVGSIDRFELSFLDGRIVQWFNLADDPNRTENLLGDGPLGPLPPDLRSAAVSTQPAARVAGERPAQQVIVSATPLRVVVRVAPDAPVESLDTASDSGIQCDYAIYADGRVYVAYTDAEAERPAANAMAFACSASAEFEFLTNDAAEAEELTDEPGEEAPTEASGNPCDGPFALFAQTADRQADLLVVPARPTEMLPLSEAATGQISALFAAEPGPRGIRFAAMCRVWPTDVDSSGHARLIACDYRSPLPLSFQAGESILTDAGDFNNDGFSEGVGHYAIRLDGNVARLQVDSGDRLRIGAAFKVIGIAGRDVWVYLDGRLIRQTYRIDNDTLLFAMPGAFEGEHLIEIIARREESGA